MNKLLKANLRRLWRSWGFWVCTALVLGFTVFYIHMSWAFDLSRNRQPMARYHLSSYLFVLLFIAIFSVLFLGRGYSDGTIRNKVIAGHRRRNIYLANLLVCIIAGSVIFLAWFLGGLAKLPHLGGWGITAGQLVLLLFLSYCSMLSAVAIVVMLCHFSTTKSSALLIVSLMSLLVVITGFTLWDGLSEPRNLELSGRLTVVDGVIVEREVDVKPNPYYVGGIRRGVYEVVFCMLPGGQQFHNVEQVTARYANVDLETYLKLGTTWTIAPIYTMNSAALGCGSLLCMVLITFVGIWAFGKKDIV